MSCTLLNFGEDGSFLQEFAGILFDQEGVKRMVLGGLIKLFRLRTNQTRRESRLKRLPFNLFSLL